MFGLNPQKYRYYARRLASSNWRDLLQRVRVRPFHRHQRQCLSREAGACPLSDFFPKQKAYLERLSTGSGARAVTPHGPDGWLGDTSFWEVFSKKYPREAEKIVSKADAILSGRFVLFGWRELELPSPIDWSRTLDHDHPDERWPQEHYILIDFYHDPSRPLLDVKWSWELNRFQHLLHLGAAWRITGDETYAAATRDHIGSWVDQVTYPLGVHWSSNLEVALRMLSWARCHILCADSSSWDTSFLTRFLPYLFVHACHVEKEFTIHHTLGNHVAGEACALLQLACLYGDFPLADRWIAKSKKIIQRVVPRLILEDGVYSEQSTGYLKFVLELLLSGLHALDAPGQDFSHRVRERMSAAIRFGTAVAPNPRSVTMIGDCDSGSAFGWYLSDYWNFESLFMASWILLPESRPEKIHQSLPAESFLLTGLKGLAEYKKMNNGVDVRAQTPSQGKGKGYSEFRSGGYVISSDSRMTLIFDDGPLGISPGYGHGHADGLAFILDVDGQPFITDPGTMLYNGPVMWRNYFRGTAAHNTVSVDGRDQSEPIDTFLWSAPLNISLDDTREGATWRLFGGSLKWGKVVHHRSLVHFVSAGVLVADVINGTGEHDIDWHLHFHPRWSLTMDAKQKVLATGPDATVQLTFFGFKKGRLEVFRGAVNPLAGWYSAAYGMIESAYTLRIRMRTRLPVKTVFTAHFSNTALHVPIELREYLNIGEWPKRSH